MRDVKLAADKLRPVYDRSGGADGFVSLEVDPHLAHDTVNTVSEARRLWHELKRPNVFIKVPGTAEGMPAVTQLISEGINVNITLLFGLDRYIETVGAYFAGIEERLKRGQAVNNVSSVASFFLSRIDTMADAMLEEIIAKDEAKAETARQ